MIHWVLVTLEVPIQGFLAFSTDNLMKGLRTRRDLCEDVGRGSLITNTYSLVRRLSASMSLDSCRKFSR
jgi:hypothetical protein